MKFPSSAPLTAWKKSKVSHADFDDWPETFITDRTTPFVVEKKLAELSKPVMGFGVLEIAIEKDGVELVMDVEEETFNERAGELATLFRASAEHGAKGTIVFLGTAGAEGDFAFELLIDKKKSRVSELTAQRSKALYASATYRAFQKQVSDLLAAIDPAYAKALAPPKAGKTATPSGDVATLFATFVNSTNLDACSDARRALAKKPLAEIEKPLEAALIRVSERKPDKNLSIVVMCDAMLVDLARTAGAKSVAKALAAVATSRRFVNVRKPAAELLLDWGLALDVLAKFEEPDAFGIGVQVARARLTKDPAKTIRGLLPITPKNTRDVLDLLEGLADDALAAKKAKRKSLVSQHPALAKLIEAARESGDEALEYHAKTARRLR